MNDTRRPLFAPVQYFAAVDGMGLVSGSGNLSDAQVMAMLASREMVRGECQVFSVSAKGICHVETVYQDGTAQPSLGFRVRG